ncbi:MAG: outer membrane protein transport protein, partial [Rhodocyclaceae bacterium]|nr:outer membrane protein transport protein [Rhodocyclaceae bacterium]
RFDLAIGGLHPDVNAKYMGMEAKSGGDAYYMPAVGYVRKDGKLTYGVGVFAQGGMGTEYAANSFMAMGSGTDARSELGVGRLIFPLAYDVSPDFTVGGSVDFVWATLDMKMAAQISQLGGMMSSPTGAFTGALGAGTDWARIDFSDSNDFSGSAKGTGWAGKLGFTYRASKQLTIGAVYQSKTSLSDLETGATGAAMTTQGGFADSGRIKVRNFQWPETYAIGLAFQATPQWLIAADVKQINWSKVMRDFKMTYESALGSFNITMPQDWKDQTVLQLGATYQMNEQLALRFGVNTARNPVPDTYLNALFPAIIKEQYTLGAGYKFSKTAELNGSLTFAPKVTQAAASGVTSEHSQTNWQLMYSNRF